MDSDQNSNNFLQFEYTHVSQWTTFSIQLDFSSAVWATEQREMFKTRPFQLDTPEQNMQFNDVLNP